MAATTPRGGRTRLRVLESLLWMGAALGLGTVAYAGLAGAFSGHVAAMIVPQAGSEGHGAETAPRVHASGDVIGRMEIPAIGLDVPITAGIETNSLIRGVGHIEGTALPGGLGTVGLAGHRDTYFRPLRHIANGMDVRVIDATGTYHYTVQSTEIVMPEQVEVLDIRNEPELTLVTCYPFDFVGQAPKRFIVHARLNSLEPDEAAGARKP